MKLKETITAIAADIKDLYSKIGPAGGSSESPYSEIESARVLRSQCPVVAGSGNTATYRVSFKKPFSQQPRITTWSAVSVGSVRITAMHTVFNVTPTGFDFTQNYVLGDLEITYTAVVDK